MARAEAGARPDLSLLVVGSRSAVRVEAVTTHKFTLRTLGVKLADFPREERDAIRKAFTNAARPIDRAIQWSIHGGGYGAAADAARARASTPKARERERVKGELERRRAMKGQRPRGRHPPLPPPEPPPLYPVPIDRGDYANSWRVRAEGNTAVVYTVAKPLIKAAVIETGRRPAPIPIRPLVGWVQRKLKVTDPRRALGIAIAISKKANEEKRPGLKVIARARPKIVAALRLEVLRGLAAARR